MPHSNILILCTCLEAPMYWLLFICTALSALRSYTAGRVRLEKNKIGTNITNFTTIWIPRSSIYNGELTLFLGARILFNIYIYIHTQ
jgi:hypothetical protein